MPNPYPSALRTRAVDAYEAGEGSYVAIAEQFSISVSSLLRWVQRTRATGDAAATAGTSASNASASHKRRIHAKRAAFLGLAYFLPLELTSEHPT